MKIALSDELQRLADQWAAELVDRRLDDMAIQRFLWSLRDRAMAIRQQREPDGAGRLRRRKRVMVAVED